MPPNIRGVSCMSSGNVVLSSEAAAIWEVASPGRLKAPIIKVVLRPLSRPRLLLKLFAHP
jgi:hypothetical protein